MKGIRKLLSSVAMSAVIVIGMPAHAQETSATTGSEAQADDEIIVRGSYAESLKKARDKKRESPMVIEALSISDLNQLPDVSVADALSRLPGLAADRDPNNGAKSQISIRGMGAALSQGTLNGRDLATPTADRNIRYDQFPSELIGGAVVYKSPMAAINEGGVAGSIDLSTVKPLDYKETVISAGLSGVYSQLGDELASDKKWGVRGSVSFIGQFADNTLGIAIGYAGRDEPFNVIRTQHSSYDPGGYTDFNADGRSDNAAYEVRQMVRYGTDERHGGVAVLEWRPSPAIHLTLDGLYSKVVIDGTLNGIIATNINQQFANIYTNPVVIGNHLISSTVTSRRGSSNTFDLDLSLQDFAAIARRHDELLSFGGNLVFSPGGGWEGTFDGAYSRVRYDADYYELTTQPVSVQGGILAVVPGQRITYDGRSNIPTLTNPNVDLASPSINRPARLNLPFLEIGRDDIYSFKNDFVYTTGSDVLTKFRVGWRYVDRTKSNRNLDQSVTLAIGSRPILSGSQVQPFALGSYNGPQTGAAPQFLTFDFFSVANQYFGGLHPVETTDSRAASWTVIERTMAGYGQLDFKFGPVTGNIGVRAIQTDDSSSSIRRVFVGSIGDIVQPFTVKNHYLDVLPSLNLNFHATDSLQFRAALAKTLARPAIDDLNAGFQAFDFGNAQAFGGNPLLEPFRADQADLTAEWYFGKSDFVAVTGFYKDLKSYITTSTQPVVIGGTTYQFFQPVNRQGGYIRGFEVTLQKNLTGLPAPFDGLGIYFNYAFVDSDVIVTRNFSDNTLGLVGLSKHTGTGTIYYYKDGFDARVSYNYRSPYARVVDGGGFETTDSAGYLDAQVSYEVVKGTSIVLQASNILNTPNRTYLGNNKAERGRYEEFGRFFYAGVRTSF